MNPYWWLAVAVIMAIVELALQGYVTIWFVVGGLAAFIAGFFGASLTVQIIVFLIVSLACLALLRPFFLKHRRMGEMHEPTLVGTQAIVVERIDPLAQTGRVETPDHMTWTALSADGLPIEAGMHVRVVEQRSIKLVVEIEV
ncbi:MAG: NfeD family protein [Eggerthellaceae bacterium]|nr:NfeD family protein [Eggerthellaceae bacterium]